MPMKFYVASDYQPRLQKMYAIIELELKAVLPNARVEHIGSSSIHGAVSKGDLDVYVGVSKESFEDTLEKIKQLGFTEKLGTLRTPQLCMLTTLLFNQDVAIQLVENGSTFEEFFHFRDILNADPALVTAYNQLKLASVGMTPEGYRAKKATFIESVLRNESKS
jgi:GrpB-like predicted nucleotidyltransferase (UPF0157 family)